MRLIYLTRDSAAAVLVLSLVTTAACGQRPKIAAGTIPAATCIVGILKSDPDVRSVSVYAVDENRSAIEFTVRDKNGNATADLMLLGTGPRESSYSFLGGSPASLRGAEYSRKIHLDLRCPIVPGFDNVQPTPKPRGAWQRVDWP